MVALKAGGRAETALPLPISSRLANLAACLPASLPQRDRWTTALAAVASAGEPNEVEAALRAPQDAIARTSGRFNSQMAEWEAEAAVREASVKKIKAELDELLDEIDDVLETNAEDFVKSYIQKGGE